jgi:hypothetical protein
MDSWSDLEDGDSMDEDADELEDVDMETLVEAGLVARTKSSKGKGKETGQVGRGHTVFADDQDERESMFMVCEIPTPNGLLLMSYIPLVLDYTPTVRTASTDKSKSNMDQGDETEELDLGWITTNRRAPQAKLKSAPIAMESDSEDASEDDEDVGGLGEIEVDAKRAEQKRVEKELQKEANVSL